MVIGGDSSENQGLLSVTEALEKKRRNLQLEIEKTDRDLERAKLGEAVAAFLNNNEQLNDVLSKLKINRPFTLNLVWDSKNEKFNLGFSEAGSVNDRIPQSNLTNVSSKNSLVKRTAAKPFGQRPPQESDYFVPILQALRALGWSATPEQITPLVLDEMRPNLKDNDFERIPSGRFIRWECRMRFARKQMKDLHPPLLNPNSPIGLWEATELGRRHLEEEENR